MARNKKQAENTKSEKMSKEQEEKLQAENIEGQAEELEQEEKAESNEEPSEESKIEELEAKNKDLNDKFLRLYSEFDNFRKRTLKEKSDLNKYAGEKTIKAILPIVDDFERAIEHLDEASQEGINLIFNKFSNILEKEGLKAIEAKGKEFDTDYHEAITQIPAPDKKMKGKVMDEVEKGYELNGKVIRFSKVVVGC